MNANQLEKPENFYFNFILSFSHLYVIIVYLSINISENYSNEAVMKAAELLNAALYLHVAYFTAMSAAHWTGAMPNQ